MIVQELLTRLGFQVNTSQLNAYNSQLRAVAQGAVALGAGIATKLMGGLIKLSAQTFGEFEAELKTIQAVSGATAEQMKKLEDQALKLGASTKFSAKEVAQAQGELSKAGLDTNQILSATPGILALASASGLNVAQSAEIAGGALNAFGLQATESQRVADLLANASNKSSVGVADLAEALKYAAPVARQAGWSMEDTVSILSVMGDNLIKGSMAGTSFAGGITRLQAPVGKALEVLEKYKIKTHDSNGTMLDSISIINNFKKGLKNATQQQKASALTAIFGQESAKGWIAVLETENSKLLKRNKELNNNTGSAKKMSDVMNSGLLPAISELSGAFETLFIKIGKQLAPSLITLAKVIGEVVNWISDLSPETHQLIANLMLLTTVIMAGLTAFMLFKMAMPVLTALKLAFLGLNLQILLIPLAILGIILIIQDFYTFLNGGESAIGNFLKPYPKLKGMVLSIIEFIKGLYNTVIATFQNLAGSISDLSNVFLVLRTGLYILATILTVVFGAFILGSATVIIAFTAIFVYIQNWVTWIVDLVVNFVTTFADITGELSVTWQLVFSSLAQIVMNYITIWIQSFLTFIQQVRSSFVSFFTATIPSILNSSFASISNFISQIYNAFSNLVSSVINFFANAFLNVIPNFISSIGTSIGNIASQISGLVGGGISIPVAVGAGGGRGGFSIGSVNNSTTVNVGGSNSSAGQIAGATGRASVNGVGKALAGASKGYKGYTR